LKAGQNDYSTEAFVLLDTIQPKDIKTGDLEEGGSAKPVYAGTDGVKRRYSSQIVSYKNKL
jgi:hypothetical protein